MLVGGYRSWGNRYRKLLGSYQLPRDACGRVIHIGRLIAKCNQLWEGMSKLGQNKARELGCDGGRQGKSNEGRRCSMNATLRGRFLIRYSIPTWYAKHLTFQAPVFLCRQLVSEIHSFIYLCNFCLLDDRQWMNNYPLFVKEILKNVC